MQVGENIALSISSGTSLPPDFIAEAALRCEIMNDIETLDAERINQFYEPTPENEGEKEDESTNTTSKRSND